MPPQQTIDVSTLRWTRPKAVLGMKQAFPEGIHKPWMEPPKYQCAGPVYDAYSQKTIEMIQKRLQMDHNNSISLWGKRPSLLPSTITNQSILITGNSHTRQVLSALLWQYEDQILQYTNLGRDQARHVLEGNNTIYSIINFPGVYSPRWQPNLQEQLHIPFHSLDVIVLGFFNPYDPNYRNGSLWSYFHNYAHKNPEKQIDLQGDWGSGFAFAQLAKNYSGPIVSLSNFRQIHQSQFLETVMEIQELATNYGRSNVRAINARAPIDAIGAGNCGTGSMVKVVDCKSECDNHRCVGDKGGVPDIVAWDLVEALYDLFS